MHRFAAKSNLVDSCSEMAKLGGFGGEEKPVCPKPHRLGAAIPEFLRPPRCSKHSQSNAEGRSEILTMIAAKNDDVQEPVCTGCCSPSCYSGSPPARTENALVHDVQFVRTKLADRFGFTSASPI